MSRESSFKKAKAKIEKTNNIFQDIHNRSEHKIVLLKDIKEPKFHDRKEYDIHKIKELSESMKNGLWQPIVLRRLKDNTLERLIGFRRIKGAEILGWEGIPSLIIDGIDDETAILIMLTENIQRVDPNIYDQTIALIDYIKTVLDCDTKYLKYLLEAYKNSRKDNAKQLTHTLAETIMLIEDSLNKIAHIKIDTFRDRTSMLDYPEILKKELINGFIYSYAKELYKIKNVNKMEKALLEIKQMQDEGSLLSVVIVKEICLQYKDDKNNKKSILSNIPENFIEIKKRLTVKNINSLDIKKQSKVGNLLNEIDKLLSNSN